MGINEKPTIVFSIYENKLRSWWDKLENDQEDDLREKKRLILLLVHPSFINDLNTCIEKIHEISKKQKKNTVQYNLELRLPKPFAEVASKWNVSFSNGLFGYILQKKCRRVEDLDIEVTKHIYAHDFFFNARVLGSGLKSLSGIEIIKLFNTRLGESKNSLLLEINLNSPSINKETLWSLYQKNKYVIQSIQKRIEDSSISSTPKAIGFPKNAADSALSMKNLKKHIELKFNDEFTGIRLSKKKGMSANRKQYSEIFEEIGKLNLNNFERDLALHYFKSDERGRFNSISAISTKGEFHIKKTMSTKKLYEKMKYLYFYIDPLIAAPDFISKRSN